jgi:hypothetical protein
VTDRVTDGPRDRAPSRVPRRARPRGPAEPLLRRRQQAAPAPVRQVYAASAPVSYPLPTHQGYTNSWDGRASWGGQ